MNKLKYLLSMGLTFTILFMIPPLFFPVDSTGSVIVQDWYIFLTLGVPLVPPTLIWLYETFFFRSQKFKAAKESVSKYIDDCNNLNQHIENLKGTALISNRTNYGNATYADNSTRNMRRPELEKRKNEPHIHNCSRTVCDNASKEPFKYICKYFGIEVNENTLHEFETILNNFEAAEDGKKGLLEIRKNILRDISKSIPWFIRVFAKQKLQKKLGFEPVDLTSLHFPKYVFQYVSSGGNASTKCEVIMDIQNLNNFVMYLSERIKFNKSAAGQRALMTSRLRTQIKERDAYTCKYCGISVAAEPHLLLEIDHIVPVSKGGLTTESNLQTLCWRCNRSKGAK